MKIKVLINIFFFAFIINGLSFADINIDLGKNIEKLKLKGDLRVRLEIHDKDKDAVDKTVHNNPRERFRTRFRLGANWKNPTEKWEIGAGLCTGGTDSTSTNATWSDGSYFETGDIRLDYAYAKHKIMDQLSFIVGQQKNPFETSWLLWDGDVRPTGFTGKADFGKIFGTFGAYEVLQNGNDIGMMYGFQGGAKIDAGNISFMGALSGYFFNNTIFDEKLFIRPNKDYSYQIIDLYGKIDLKIDKKIKLSSYLQIFNNTGADGKIGEGMYKGKLDPDSEALGWILGASAKIHDASFKISYAQVGADSCVPYLKNGDFGSGFKGGVDIDVNEVAEGVNVQGIVIAAGYKITKHFQVETTGYFYQQLEEVELNDDDNEKNMQMFHIDLKYKF